MNEIETLQELEQKIQRSKKFFNGKYFLVFRNDALGYLLYEAVKNNKLLPPLFLFQKENRRIYDVILRLEQNKELSVIGKILLKADWFEQLKKIPRNKKNTYAIRYGNTENEITLSNISKNDVNIFADILYDKLYNFVNKKLSNEQEEKIKPYLNQLDEKENEYILVNKLINLNPKKYTKEMLIYGVNFPEHKDDSKTLYETIDRGAILEGIEITDYTREQLAQKMVEIIQDAFKDYKEKWRLNKLEDKDVIAFIDNHLVRQREYQRWTDDELKNLWYLWKYECKRIPDIARLMQRTAQSCNKMIDFIEKYGKKYQNLDNHYKRIITKAGALG